MGDPFAEHADIRKLLFQWPVLQLNRIGVIMPVANALAGRQIADGNIRFMGAKYSRIRFFVGFGRLRCMLWPPQRFSVCGVDCLFQFRIACPVWQPGGQHCKPLRASAARQVTAACITTLVVSERQHFFTKACLDQHCSADDAGLARSSAGLLLWLVSLTAAGFSSTTVRAAESNALPCRCPAIRVRV